MGPGDRPRGAAGAAASRPGRLRRWAALPVAQAVACACAAAAFAEGAIIREGGWGIVHVGAPRAADPRAPEAQQGVQTPLRDRALEAALRDAVERVIRATLRRDGREPGTEAFLEAWRGDLLSYVAGYRVLADRGVVPPEEVPGANRAGMAAELDPVEPSDPLGSPDDPDPPEGPGTAAYVIVVEASVRFDALRARLLAEGLLAVPLDAAVRGPMALVLEGPLSYRSYRQLGAALREVGASVEERSFHRSGVELEVVTQHDSVELYAALRQRLEPALFLELRAGPPGELRLRLIERVGSPPPGGTE